jgi:uncharacterized protein (TIGR03067 family)
MMNKRCILLAVCMFLILAVITITAGSCSATRNGSEWTFEFFGSYVVVNGPSGEWYEGDFVVDDTVTPNTVDITIENSSFGEEYKGKVSLGIFELSGNSLKLCCNEPDNPTRPTAFGQSGARTWQLTRDGNGTGIAGDWVGTESNGNGGGNGGDDDEDGGGFLPGFELAGLITVLVIALIINHRRKN